VVIRLKSSDLTGVYRVFEIVAGEGRITLIDRIVKSEDPEDLLEAFYEAIRMARSVEKEKIELSEEEVEKVISNPRVIKRIAIKAAALAYKRREEGEEEAKKEEKGGEEEGNE
jgi:hypothetical protein